MAMYLHTHYLEKFLNHSNFNEPRMQKGAIFVNCNPTCSRKYQPRNL